MSASDVVSLYNKLCTDFLPGHSPNEARALAKRLIEHETGSTWAAIWSGITPLSKAHQGQIEQSALRIARGEPLQYVLGACFFGGLTLHVAPGVLIPRVETEEMLLGALRDAPVNARLRVIDLCSGSGCMALAWKHHRPNDEVHALELSAEALSQSKSNARRLNLDVDIQSGDLLNPAQWPLGTYHRVLSNPPYILPEERATLDAHVLAHEPAMALFAPPADALAFYRAIRDFCNQNLAPGGTVYMETDWQRAHAVGALFDTGYKWQAKHDMQGKWRVVVAQKNQPVS